MAKQRNSVCKLAAAVALAASTSGAVQAASIVNDGDWNVRWDNTFKYSAITRTESPDKEVANASTPTTADGSLNFKRGSLVSNRVDWRTELDVIWRQNYGFRLSAAAWYDDAYNHGTDYEEQASHHNPVFRSGPAAGLPYGNQYSGTQPSGEFTQKTVDYYTGNAEFQDAFVFANFEVAGMGGTVRLGSHTIYYGNSLFGTAVANSIAGGMTSLDADKALGSPGTEAKELFMPSNKISMDLSITDNLNLSMFYGLEYLPQRMPQAGAFFSPVADLNINPDQGSTVGNFQALGTDVRGGVKFVSFDEPDDTSEYGFSLQYYFQPLDVEVAFHYLNTYSRGPGNLKTDFSCGMSAADVATIAGVPGLDASQIGAAYCSAKYSSDVSPDSPLAGAIGAIGTTGSPFLVASLEGANPNNPNGYDAILGEGTWVVKEDINIYGLSLSKEWQGISWGVDLTYFEDALITNTLTYVAPSATSALGGTIAAGPDGDAATLGLTNADNPELGLDSLSSTNTQSAEGNVLGLVVNAIGLLKANNFWDGGSWIVEYTGSQLLEVTNRPDTLNFGIYGNGDDANTDLNRIASHIQVRFAPTWFQVMPGVDLNVPITVSHGFGDQAGAFTNQLDFTTYTVAAEFNINQKYDVALRYVNFGGSISGTGHNLKDRDNISLTVKATF